MINWLQNKLDRNQCKQPVLFIVDRMNERDQLNEIYKPIMEEYNNE